MADERSARSSGNRPVPSDPLHGPVDADERLRRWLDSVLATPGLTSIRDHAEARRALLDDSLRGVELVRRFEGPVVDVGSGGGAPGIPLAAAFPGREVVLLEANGRRCAFLEDVASAFPNVRVLRGRGAELLRLYSGMNASMERICAAYGDRELELIGDFLRRTAHAGRSAVGELTEGG